MLSYRQMLPHQSILYLPVFKFGSYPLVLFLNAEFCSQLFTNIAAATTVPKFITTSEDQTLTCTIGGLTASGTAATVVWKDPLDKTVTDDDDYDIDNGTPDGSGTQSAELTIKTAKLTSDFASQSSITYKCSIHSALYPDSFISSDVNVVATVLKLGNSLSESYCRFKLLYAICKTCAIVSYTSQSRY